jgi:hypothetical protein
MPPMAYQISSQQLEHAVGLRVHFEDIMRKRETILETNISVYKDICNE